jgi:hypothetical protein
MGWSKQLPKLASGLAIVIMIVSAVYTFVSTPKFFETLLLPTQPRRDSVITQTQIDEAILKLRKDVKTQIDEIKATINDVAQLPSGDKVYIQLQQLNSTVNDLRVREDKLEA